jgi:hypothetical protein
MSLTSIRQRVADRPPLQIVLKAKRTARAGSMTPTALSSDAGLGFKAPEARRPETNAVAKRAEALMKGYQGDACGECGNFTLVRNGTCLKCDTCGSTTGCS